MAPVPPELEPEQHEYPHHRKFSESYELLAAKKRETKLLALTVDADEYVGDAEPFGRGWARARMWDQYAEKSRGVCLLFNRAGLDRAIREHFEARDVRLYGGEVEYTRTGLVGRVSATQLEKDVLYADDRAGPFRDHLERYVRDLFFLKLEDWRSEHEYRYVALTEGEEYEHIHTRGSLRAVVVGHAFPTWANPAILAACRGAGGVDAMRLRWDEGRPLLKELLEYG